MKIRSIEKVKEEEMITTLMDLNKFWNLIEKIKFEDKTDTKISKLKEELSILSPTDIVKFENRFSSLKNKAYRWNLWGAIYLLNGGCSDDSFEYFREWLICQGKDKFENAIIKPESIIEFVSENEDWEGLGYCAEDIYKKKTRTKYIPSNSKQRDEPIGKEWDEDDLPNMFPLISKKIESKNNPS